MKNATSDIEEKSILDRDYRIQAITTLAKDFTSPWTGIVHKKGTSVELVGFVKYDEKHVLDFPIPNMAALFLDQSYVSWEESQEFLKKERFLETPSKNLPKGTIYPKEDFLFFDVIQKRMIAIIFAYTALEAFANESIPDEYTFEREREDKKCLEKYAKDQIEFLSLDIKLGEILPVIFNTKTIKGTQIWNKYKFLKKLRDRIVHLKSKDRKSNKDPNEDTIWKELLDRSYANAALQAFEIISYFLNTLSEDKMPRWFKKFPFNK